MQRRINRKYGYLSKVYKLTKLDTGIELLLPVFEDLTTEELKLSLRHFVSIDDFEYANEIKSELQLRGI